MTAERLQQYAIGTLGPLHWPDCYAKRPWIESAHKHFPPHFRALIRTLLLASNRRKEGEVRAIATGNPGTFGRADFLSGTVARACASLSLLMARPSGSP